MKRLVGLIFSALLSVLVSCNKMENNLEQNMYGFTVRNWKAKLAGFPSEDSFAYNKEKRIACVADGVTRDFLDGTVVTPDLKGLIKFWKGLYPEYAKDASDIFTETYFKTKSFEEANNAIWNYNIEKGLVPTNYLDKDLAGCIAASAFEKDGVVYYAFIADSGVAIFNKEGDLEFKTKDEGPHSSEKNPYLESILEAHGGGLSQEGRKIIRSKYRNNPSEPYSYGVLTGEPEAMHYVKNGKKGLFQGDYVLVFTDGIKEIMFSKDKYEEERINSEFVETLIKGDFKGIERLCRKNIHTEGTLVVMRKE